MSALAQLCLFIFFNIIMICGNNEQCSKSNVQENNTKQELSKQGRLKHLVVRSGVMEERASSADRSYPPCALWALNI